MGLSEGDVMNISLPQGVLSGKMNWEKNRNSIFLVSLAFLRLIFDSRKDARSAKRNWKSYSQLKRFELWVVFLAGSKHIPTWSG
jgi:hypothetical protein